MSEVRLYGNNILKSSTCTIENGNELLIAAQSGRSHTQLQAIPTGLRRYKLDYGNLDCEIIKYLTEFYVAMRGRFGEVFRFFDFFDNYLNDEQMAIDGTDVIVPIYKRYYEDPETKLGSYLKRRIMKIAATDPNDNPLSFFVWVNDVLQNTYTVDCNNGTVIVTGTGMVKVSCYFDVPVQFTSFPQLQIVDGKNENISNIEILEVHHDSAQNVTSVDCFA